MYEMKTAKVDAIEINFTAIEKCVAALPLFIQTASNSPALLRTVGIRIASVSMSIEMEWIVKKMKTCFNLRCFISHRIQRNIFNVLDIC